MKKYIKYPEKIKYNKRNVFFLYKCTNIRYNNNTERDDIYFYPNDKKLDLNIKRKKKNTVQTVVENISSSTKPFRGWFIKGYLYHLTCRF